MSKGISKYYFNNPQIWDELCKERINKESDFLIHIFDRYKVHHILDVGSGSGAHLKSLTRHGFSGVGVDLNENMIRYSKQKYPDIPFELANMRDLPYNNEFDALMCLCTTFCYNIENKDAVSALRSFYRSLKKDGVLIIETFNPIAFIEKIKYEKKLIEREDYIKFGLVSHVEHSINELSQTMTERRSFYRSSDNENVSEDITEFRLFFPQELNYLLETNGFKMVECYGSYDESHKCLDKFRLITVSVKM